MNIIETIKNIFNPIRPRKGNSKPIDFSSFPDDILIASNKELAFAYSKALVGYTKEPNNESIKTALNNYKNELDVSEKEIKRRNLKSK
jgi:hypothetical protein